MKKAFITGITGQDGSYLAELLLEKNYQVHAIMRRVSVFTTQRINHFFEHPNLIIHYGDLTDSSNLNRLISRIKPNEIYNLGSQSHVGISFEVPEYTAEVNAIGTIRLLDSIRDLNINCRYYQASTSEIFGGIKGTEPQNENTPFYPKSPYSVAKLYAHWITINYRESYNIYACNGILFNHESPRRGATFVSKKITKSVAKIYQAKQSVLTLGNLDAKRDWGHAKDYVYAQWLMLQQDMPKDYVIATGEAHSVREFVEVAFAEIGIKIIWQGSGINEQGIDAKTGTVRIKVDKKYFRPSEVNILLGNPKKAEQILGWKKKTDFKTLVHEMVAYDLKNDDIGG